MIFESALRYSSYNPYSIYFRMVISSSATASHPQGFWPLLGRATGVGWISEPRDKMQATDEHWIVTHP